jgi:Uma2 family endonuclease
MVTLQLRQLDIPPGQQIRLRDIDWPELENILDELGDRRAARIAYANRTLEIMTPLPEHEDDKEILGDLVKIILEERDIEFRTLGSTTFKNAVMEQAIEPDQCFYIANEARIRGKKRLDLAVDPPPDLAIEIDITSRTHRDIYATLGVPELWRFEGASGVLALPDRLQVNLLQNGQYIEVPRSPTFPDIPLDRLLETLEQSRTLGRNTALKTFRQWLRSLSP